MKRVIGLLSIVFISVSVLMVYAQVVGLGLFKHEVYRNPKGEKLPYCFLEPQSAEAGKRYPLVMFYHGAGERGDDNNQQLVNGAKLFVQPDVQKKYPCYMIAAQCPLVLKWVDTDWKLDAHIQPDTPATPLRLSMELMREVIKKYPIDTNRIYITGLSMGGFATWDAITRYPGVFAAAAPVCGGGDVHKAYLLKNFPIWAFHGAKDKLVKPTRSRDMIHAIENEGGHPKYTEYPALGHNAWDSAYKDSRVLEWMFAQKRNAND